MENFFLLYNVTVSKWLKYDNVNEICFKNETEKKTTSNIIRTTEIYKRPKIRNIFQMKQEDKLPEMP